MLYSWIYNLLINTGWLIARLGAPFFASMNKFVSERQQAWPDIDETLRRNNKVLWMHCASLGEYEQGKSLLIKIKENNPNIVILLSFFSASGYEHVETGKLIDYKCYLPLDSHRNTKKFIEHFQPDQAIFVKYEFWFNFIRIINQKRIPLIFISVILRKSHYLFKSYGAPILNELKNCTQIYVQDEATNTLLKKRDFTNVIISGDTRIDAVKTLAKTPFEDTVINSFCSDSKPVIVAGSCWEEDIELLGNLKEEILKKYKWIIAAHDISSRNTGIIKKKFKDLNQCIHSSGDDASKAEVLIIDSIGILKYVYRYARIVYIGGGFGTGIHNTLEPGAYGKPVIFGPRFEKFREAKDLVSDGAFFTIKDHQDMEKVLFRFEEKDFYNSAVSHIESYINENSQATELILDKMERF